MDGSGSVQPPDFEKMKEFVINLVRSLKGKYTQVELLYFILKSFVSDLKIQRGRITLFVQ